MHRSPKSEEIFISPSRIRRNKNLLSFEDAEEDDEVASNFKMKSQQAFSNDEAERASAEIAARQREKYKATVPQNVREDMIFILSF